MKRIFLIVLDSFGIGAMPDSESFGDVGVNTLAACATSPELNIPNMIAAGLGNIEGVHCLPKAEAVGACARLTEKSMGKDTTIGHWEIAGIVSPDPLPTYPKGFPQEVLDAFEEATGRGCLCNLPYSGTDVIRDYGQDIVMIPVNGPGWHWNGDKEKPTFSPSLLTRTNRGDDQIRNHVFVRDGVVEYLHDCSHELAGKKLELPRLKDWPDELKLWND